MRGLGPSAYADQSTHRMNERIKMWRYPAVLTTQIWDDSSSRNPGLLQNTDRIGALSAALNFSSD
jgi:hypothetical protein